MSISIREIHEGRRTNRGWMRVVRLEARCPSLRRVKMRWRLHLDENGTRTMVKSGLLVRVEKAVRCAKGGPECAIGVAVVAKGRIEKVISDAVVLLGLLRVEALSKLKMGIKGTDRRRGRRVAGEIVEQVHASAPSPARDTRCARHSDSGRNRRIGKDTKVGGDLVANSRKSNNASSALLRPKRQSFEILLMG